MSVFAWRTWNLNPEGLLVATAAGVPWLPGVNEAECRKPNSGITMRYYPATGQSEFVRPEPEHPAPESGCTCGYWAFKTPARLLREFGRRLGQDTVARRVYGVVELAGRMIELELGYKAQHARIVALAAPEGMSVSPDYNVPVQHDLGALFRTWWDGVQPQDTEWRDDKDDPWSYAMGGMVSGSISLQMADAMKRMFQQYGQMKSSYLTWTDPDPVPESDPIKAENPAAERDLKVRAKNDRPKWQSTYGPSKGRR